MAKPGPKKGAVYKPTIQKEQAREALRQIVLKHMKKLVQAQLDNATGIAHMLLRDKKTGQFERLTKLADIQAALNDPDAKEGSTYYVYTKDPSVQSFTDLMNRALDKPKEQAQEVTVSGDDALIAALMAGRQFMLKRREGE